MTYTTGFNEQEPQAELIKNTFNVNAVEYKNSYQEQLEQLCRKRWLALHEIATEGKKRGVDWCVEKAREGEV